MSPLLAAALDALPHEKGPRRTISRPSAPPTSLTLEDEYWAALQEIAEREGLRSRSAVIARVVERCGHLGMRRVDGKLSRRGFEPAKGLPLPPTVVGVLRVFVVTYFRHAAMHSMEVVDA